MTTRASQVTVTPAIRRMVRALVFAALLAAALILTWLVYRPGLSGVFLFDDFNNLAALGATGPIDHWATFWRYITSGVADPIGRPLTMLSFLIDAQNWPADPWSFKYTSVLIHLLNGALLIWAMLALGRRAGLDERRSAYAAVLGAAFWLLHPLFVSTTLYIVQREAMLPATFTFCGLLCWCKGRDRLDDGRTFAAWVWMIAGTGLCTLLAILCKANGALLPLFIAVAELTVLRSPVNRAQVAWTSRRQRLALLGVPILLLVLGMLAEIPSATRSAAEGRPWTIGQRLLTEPRVLLDYLRLLWLPRATSFGLFNDQVQASSDWLHPWTTLPSVVAVLGLCVFGWCLRKHRPILAFAILFYFAGQIMESTFLPLELAFEHRNYLPAAFIFWPLAVWATDSRGSMRIARSALAGLLVVLVASLTLSRASVWGNAAKQVLIWGRINPDSGRAQAYAAAAEQANGRFADAIRRLRTAVSKHPNDLQLTLNLASAECRTGLITPETWHSVHSSLEHTTDSTDLMYNWFLETIPKAQEHQCVGLTLDALRRALTAARVNPKFEHQPGRQQNYEHIAGLIDLATDRPQQALDDFDAALAASPNPGTALNQAAKLGASGYSIYGLRHLDFAQTQLPHAKTDFGMPSIHSWVLQRQHYWQHETAYLRTILTSDAAARRDKPDSPAG